MKSLLLAAVASFPVGPRATSSTTTLTVPVGKVSTSLTRFPLRINLAHMSTAFWQSVAGDGGNIRVTTSADALVPIDVVSINTVNRTGEVFALVSLSSAANNVFKVKTSQGLTMLSPTDANGRNAVWSDYKAVFFGSAMVDRTGIGGTILIEGDTPNFNYTSIAESPTVNCHQGVAYDGTYYYTIHTDFVQKRDAAWNILATLNLSSVSIPNVNHFGDGCIWNGKLVVTVEKYTNNPYNNQHLVVINTATMTVDYTIDISAGLHELSGVTYHPIRDRFYVTDFTAAGNSVLHVYTTTGVYEGVFNHDSSLPLKQAISYRDGRFWISGGPGAAPTIHSIDDTTGEVRLEWTGHPGAAIEGLECLSNGDILVLFDGVGFSKVLTFSPTAASVVAGWFNLDGRGNAKFINIARTTAWTMGASIIPKDLTVNNAILSWSEAVEDNSSRASLVARLIGYFGIWNSANTWLNADTSPAPQVGVRARVHHTQNGASNRKIYVNGLLGATQNTVSQRPSAAATTVYIGAEDTSYAERLRGALNYVYVRSGESSAALLKAECDSWETDSFYTVA